VRLLSAGLLVLIPGASAAQTLRDYDYARPLHGERELKAHIEFAAGRLVLGPGSPNQLYQMRLQYDAERFRPLGSYDAGAGEVRLGVESNGQGGIRIGRREALAQTATLQFATSVPLALELSLGAAEADLELGGYRISALDLKSGASRLAVGFGSPNPGRCRSATVSAGAGEVTIANAGNSGCSRWEVSGGVGSVTMDLGGAWPTDAVLQLSMAVGGVTLQAPRGLGLRITMSGFLADFRGDGFSKNGRTYISANYERATRKLVVQVNSALGGVKVEWK
jgi:hypothetical protein